MNGRLTLREMSQERVNTQIQGVLQDVHHLYAAVQALRRSNREMVATERLNSLARTLGTDAAVIDGLIDDIAGTLDSFQEFVQDYRLFVERCVQQAFGGEAGKRREIVSRIKREWLSLRPLIRDRLSVLGALPTDHLAAPVLAADEFAADCIDRSGLDFGDETVTTARVYFEKTFSISRFFYVSRMPSIAIPLEEWRDPWNWMGLAHEIGHFVYANYTPAADTKIGDLGEILRNTFFNKLLATAQADVKHELWTWQILSELLPVWERWVEEIFADCYGVIVLGPAYIESLIAYLGPLLSPEGLLADDEDHPYPLVRPLLQIETLRQMIQRVPSDGAADAALLAELAALAKDWLTLCGDTLKVGDPPAFDRTDDVMEYVQRMLSRGERGVPAKVAFTAISLAAETAVDVLLNHAQAGKTRFYSGTLHQDVRAKAALLAGDTKASDIAGVRLRAVKLAAAWYAWSQIKHEAQPDFEQRLGKVRRWALNLGDEEVFGTSQSAQAERAPTAVDKRAFFKRYLQFKKTALEAQQQEAVDRYARAVLSQPKDSPPFNGDTESLQKIVNVLLEGEFSTGEGWVCRQCGSVTYKVIGYC